MLSIVMFLVFSHTGFVSRPWQEATSTFSVDGVPCSTCQSLTTPKSISTGVDAQLDLSQLHCPPVAPPFIETSDNCKDTFYFSEYQEYANNYLSTLGSLVFQPSPRNEPNKRCQSISSLYDGCIDPSHGPIVVSGDVCGRAKSFEIVKELIALEVIAASAKSCSYDLKNTTTDPEEFIKNNLKGYLPASDVDRMFKTVNSKPGDLSLISFKQIQKALISSPVILAESLNRCAGLAQDMTLAKVVTDDNLKKTLCSDRDPNNKLDGILSQVNNSSGSSPTYYQQALKYLPDSKTINSYTNQPQRNLAREVVGKDPSASLWSNKIGDKTVYNLLQDKAKTLCGVTPPAPQPTPTPQPPPPPAPQPAPVPTPTPQPAPAPVNPTPTPAPVSPTPVVPEQTSVIDDLKKQIADLQQAIKDLVSKTETPSQPPKSEEVPQPRPTGLIPTPTVNNYYFMGPIDYGINPYFMPSNPYPNPFAYPGFYTPIQGPSMMEVPGFTPGPYVQPNIFERTTSFLNNFNQGLNQSNRPIDIFEE